MNPHVQQGHGLPLADEHGKPPQDPAHAQSRDERGYFQLRVENTVEESGQPANTQDDGDDPQTHVVRIDLVADQETDEHDAERHDPLDGEIDAAQHNDLVEADGDDGGNGGEAENHLQVGEGQVPASGPDCKDSHDDYQ